MIGVEDEARWLTVRVVQLSQRERIVERRVDTPPDTSGPRWWGPSHFLTLRYAYRKAPFFELYAPKLRELLHARWDHLVDLNLATLEFLRGALDITTPMVRSSNFPTQGQPSQLLLDNCKQVGASAFFAGMVASRAYLDHKAFAAATLGVVWQEYEHPAYPQCGEAGVIKGLSALDVLFNCGPASAEILRRGAVRADERLAA